MKNPEIVIIGAGAIGLSLAYELVCRGRRVLVVERDRLSRDRATGTITASGRRSATTWAAAGILPPANLQRATDPIDRLRGLSHQRFPKLVKQLESESGTEIELTRCGGWYMADTPGEKGAMVGMQSYWSDLDIQCEQTSLAEFAKREPMLAHWAKQSKDACVWWVPDEWQIRTSRYLNALANAFVQRGGVLHDNYKVDSIEEVSQGVQISAKDQPTISAPQLVLCSGVRTGTLDETLALQHSVVPVRGQIMLLKAEPGLFSSIANMGHRYIVPRRDGHLLIGSNEEEVGLQHGTTPAALSELREFVREVCPTLSRCREVTAWSGLRPMTFDGFPMIGKLPSTQNIFVASGHFRSGIHLSPGTALCLADLISGDTPPIDLTAFRVGKQQSRAESHHAWKTS